MSIIFYVIIKTWDYTLTINPKQVSEPWKKSAKKKEQLAAKKAKREAKREEEELAELERLTNPNASPEDNQET